MRANCDTKLRLLLLLLLQKKKIFSSVFLFFFFFFCRPSAQKERADLDVWIKNGFSLSLPLSLSLSRRKSCKILRRQTFSLRTKPKSTVTKVTTPFGTYERPRERERERETERTVLRP